jgi:uncharacterized protein (TIGR02646 family)
MRNLVKLAEPNVLIANKAYWTAEYAAKGTNYWRFKYRHKDIKTTLKQETANKCIYCESRIGHNTPGDVEHKIPSSVNAALHFEWGNLTIACTECNRRKNAYFDALKPFLDPYNDNVEQRLVHHGPIVGWVAGDQEAEISVKTLKLDETSRLELLGEKVEKIADLNNKLARLRAEHGSPLEPILKQEIVDMTLPSAKYSAMISSILNQIGFA